MMFNKPKTIDDLKQITLFPNENLRRKVQIGIIDDEEFQYFGLLTKQHDFLIKELGDIRDIHAVSEYHVILCDIKGVGKHFQSRFEGAHIIKEIRKTYPTKVVIAYTGHSFDASYNPYFQIADDVIKKDVSLDEWVDILDRAIRLSLNPIEQWKRIRTTISSQNITGSDIMQLEDEYVKAILSRKAGFPSEKKKEQLPQEVVSVLTNFASSLLFKMLIG